jgi:two-component system OmpR family sensor kinase
MNRSLQRHLSKMLALAVLVCGAIASLVAFYLAYAEAQEFQDDTLQQIAALSVGTVSEIRQLDAISKNVNDPESRIHIIRLPDGPRPAWLSEDISPGFHTLHITTYDYSSVAWKMVADLSSPNRRIVETKSRSTAHYKH